MKGDQLNAILKWFWLHFLSQTLHIVLGQIDPWRKTEKGTPYYTILVTLDDALERCKSWSGQDIARKDFISYLKLNDVILLQDVEEFKKVKEKPVGEIKEKRTRNISEAQRDELRERAKSWNEQRNAAWRYLFVKDVFLLRAYCKKNMLFLSN